MSSVSGRYYGGRALALALFFAACMDGPQGGVGPSSAALELPFSLPTDQILPTQEIGTLTGTLSAGLDGQASYTMALAVPPGRAGMHPNLTLTYSSGAGNGPLGMGFAIQGLTSSITRCVHPHEQGGARRVRFDAQGRFCLDGQPLVLLAGQYGGVGRRFDHPGSDDHVAWMSRSDWDRDAGFNALLLSSVEPIAPVTSVFFSSVYRSS